MSWEAGLNDAPLSPEAVNRLLQRFDAGGVLTLEERASQHARTLDSMSHGRQLGDRMRIDVDDVRDAARLLRALVRLSREGVEDAA